MEKKINKKKNQDIHELSVSVLGGSTLSQFENKCVVLEIIVLLCFLTSLQCKAV